MPEAPETEIVPAGAFVRDSVALKCQERYASLQGEGAHLGMPCYFIRTSVCDLRCRWCDTPEALTGLGAVRLDIAELAREIPEWIKLVQITGGEPMLQRDGVIALIELLTGAPHSKKVLLETGGHRSLAGLPSQTHVVMDIKLPGSGEAAHDFAANLKHLKSTDEIKFVIADRRDFDAALEWIREFRLAELCDLLFSPVWGELALADLAAWILESQAPVRLQTQLHKHIWGGAARGV
jgi:7-carboxy-7-deazaguanine synthase